MSTEKQISVSLRYGVTRLHVREHGERDDVTVWVEGYYQR